MSRIALSTAGPRDLVALRQSLAALPRRARAADRVPGAARASLLGELDDLPDVRAWIEAADRRRAAGAGARRRLRARRRRQGSRRAAPHQPIGQAGHRRDGGAGARAHRASSRSRSASTACSATTSKSRSRTCTRCPATIIASRRSPAASASSRRRSRTTRRRCSAPTSGSSSASSRSSRRCGSVSPPNRRGCSTRRGRWRARRAGRAGRDGDGLQLHQAARARWRRDRRRRRAPSRRRAAGRRHVRAERHPARRQHASARDPHRPEHGRQVDLPAAGGAALPAGAVGIVRAGARGQDRPRRSPLRARRRVGQHRARPVDVHGRDAGDRAHPAAARRRRAWSCSTRSAAARRPSTA